MRPTSDNVGRGCGVTGSVMTTDFETIGLWIDKVDDPFGSSLPARVDLPATILIRVHADAGCGEWVLAIKP